ncbi:MAG: nucleotidyltransferase domain-containing protein [Nitrospirota bacterium]
MSRSLQAALADLAGRHGLDAVYAFGSRSQEVAALVRGEPAVSKSPRSDVDIGVLPKPGIELSARDRVRLMAAFEDRFHAPRVDLVVLPEASAFLAAEVVDGALLYDASPDRTAEFELYVLRRAGDLVGFERERQQLILRAGGR